MTEVLCVYEMIITGLKGISDFKLGNECSKNKFLLDIASFFIITKKNNESMWINAIKKICFVNRIVCLWFPKQITHFNNYIWMFYANHLVIHNLNYIFRLCSENNMIVMMTCNVLKMSRLLIISFVFIFEQNENIFLKWRIHHEI